MFKNVKEMASHNMSVIQNFILHITHKSENDPDEQETFETTSAGLYQAANVYIKEDHVDGLERAETEAPANHYRVVTARSAAELQIQVAQLQQDGWSTDGPHQVVPTRSYDQYAGNQHRAVVYEYEYSQTLTY